MPGAMINKIIARILPYMPKSFVWLFSKRYIAGKNIDNALFVSEQLNRKGIKVTVDLLGEFIHTILQAQQNRDQYCSLIKKFSDAGIDGGFSVKPTSFGLLIDKEKCYAYIRQIVAQAVLYNKFVRIDMEDSQCTSSEIDLYIRLKNEFGNHVGLVLQAYLKRTRNDILYMVQTHHSEQSPLNFRLCKGIYVEPPNIAYPDYETVRKSFLDNLERLFEKKVFVAIASHDVYLIEQAQLFIKKHKVPKNMYEFQMLYGVAPVLRDRLVMQGHTVRIYVPFGADWFGYCTRRINENPKMVYDILKAIFVRR